uniref:Uncharacterized protein LOC114344790 isoform X1 n=1 Tax=Diabrotica virgifera virgifera TaxID=50390 RepID=A0A6P7H124_DIAVI
MASQDSGYESEETIIYDAELDRVLEKYEEAAKDEPYYLLEPTYPIGCFHIKIGLSPARQFSPSIILYQHGKFTRISLNTFEWTTLIEMFIQIMEEFFIPPLPTCSDEYDPIEFECGDFCKLRQLVMENVKFLTIEKSVIEYYLCEDDVSQILRANIDLVSQRVSLLDKLQFFSYYRNVVYFIQQNCHKSNSLYSRLHALTAFCGIFPDTLLSQALNEYVWYYSNKVVNDLDNC